ncbi:hypothetical protein AB0B28_15705 [Glycomyces sp. NPDC046736]|uniref:hypothetical protein n=1 Tax=Glycomyces sp. NPDC046736 TaxID=3155615 RepID=UPI0033D90FAA
MSRAERHIRITGERRDVIDTDRLAALLLRAALRRSDTDGDAECDVAAPDSDTGDDKGEPAA